MNIYCSTEPASYEDRRVNAYIRELLPKVFPYTVCAYDRIVNAKYWMYATHVDHDRRNFIVRFYMTIVRLGDTYRHMNFCIMIKYNYVIVKEAYVMETTGYRITYDTCIHNILSTNIYDHTDFRVDNWGVDNMIRQCFFANLDLSKKDCWKVSLQDKLFDLNCTHRTLINPNTLSDILYYFICMRRNQTYTLMNCKCVPTDTGRGLCACGLNVYNFKI